MKFKLILSWIVVWGLKHIIFKAKKYKMQKFLSSSQIYLPIDISTINIKLIVGNSGKYYLFIWLNPKNMLKPNIHIWAKGKVFHDSFNIRALYGRTNSYLTCSKLFRKYFSIHTFVIAFRIRPFFY